LDAVIAAPVVENRHHHSPVAPNHDARVTVHALCTRCARRSQGKKRRKIRSAAFNLNHQPETEMTYLPHIFLIIMGGASLAATFTSPVF